MKKERFTQYIKDNEDRVIIFGTKIHGRRVDNICKLNGIKPACFCDNDETIIGKTVGRLSVCSINEILKTYKNPIFIIAVMKDNNVEAITNQLKKNVDNNVLEYYQLLDFIGKIDTFYPQNVTDRLYNSYYKLVYYEPNENPALIMNAIGLYVTDKCTLKCKDCSNLMQYFEDPIHCETEQLYKNIDLVDLYFDELKKLSILGGEPFIHKDIYKIIAYAQTKKNIVCVSIITNATIPPNVEELKKLKKENLQIVLSNYGELSKELATWLRVLSELGITYWYRKNLVWLDCGDVKNYNRTKEENEVIYNTCVVKGAASYLIDGKLFICPHASGLYRLNGMPKSEIEYLEIDDDIKPYEILKQEIKDMIYNSTHHNVCNYCKGRTPGLENRVPIGIQASKPLIYKKHD